MRKRGRWAWILAMVCFCTGCTGMGDDGITKEEEVSLRIGVMPAVDSAPIWWAESHGYFEKYCIKVVPVVFNNSKTMEESITQERLDANMMSVPEFLSYVGKNRNHGRITTCTDGKFPLVISPHYHQGEPAKIALMENSITNYVADTRLQGYDLQKIFVNEIPDRLLMLRQKEIEMAVLPEPLAAQAEMEGMIKRNVTDNHEPVENVIVFMKDALLEKKNAIKAFHLAYNEAIEDMAGKDLQVKKLIAEKLSLQEEVLDYIDLPYYRKVHLPSEKSIRAMESWSADIGKKPLEFRYRDLVERNFVP